MVTEEELIAQSLERQDKFFKSYTDKGIDPFKPSEDGN